MANANLLFTKDHEWAKIDGDIAIVGITDHAQEILGELTYVELPAVDTEVNRHDEIAVVESVKSANDVYSPVTGKVIESNKALESKPEIINDDCYGEGWICKIQISDKNSLKNLMTATQYHEYVKEL